MYWFVGADAVLETIEVAARVMLLQACVHAVVPFSAMVLVLMVIIEDTMEDIMLLPVIVAPVPLALVIVDEAVAGLPVPVADGVIVSGVDAEEAPADDCVCAAGEAVISPLDDVIAEYALQSMLAP